MGDTDTGREGQETFLQLQEHTPHSSSPPRSLSHAGVTFNTQTPTAGEGGQLSRATGPRRAHGGHTVPGIPQTEGARFKGEPRTSSPNRTISKILGCSHKTLSGLCNLQLR